MGHGALIHQGAPNPASRSASRGGLRAGGEIGADDPRGIGDVGLDGAAGTFDIVLGEVIQELAVMVLGPLEAIFRDREVEQRPGLEPEESIICRAMGMPAAW